jgi:hypothetical protein
MSTLKVNTITETTSGAGVTVEGVLLKDGIISADTINEKTSNAGVTAEGVLLKDNYIDLPATGGLRLKGNVADYIFCQAPATFNGVQDDVSMWAYNMVGGGDIGRVDASKQQLKLQFESDYFDGSIHWAEFLLDRFDVTTQRFTRYMGLGVHHGDESNDWWFRVIDNPLGTEGVFSITNIDTSSSYIFKPAKTHRRFMNFRFAGGDEDNFQMGYFGDDIPYRFVIGPRAMTDAPLIINQNNNVVVGSYTDGMTDGGSLAVTQDFAHRGSKAGFFNTAPQNKPTGVAVSAAGIHAALVTLGLIAA